MGNLSRKGTSLCSSTVATPSFVSLVSTSGVLITRDGLYCMIGVLVAVLGFIQLEFIRFKSNHRIIVLQGCVSGEPSRNNRIIALIVAPVPLGIREIVDVAAEVKEFGRVGEVRLALVVHQTESRLEVLDSLLVVHVLVCFWFVHGSHAAHLFSPLIKTNGKFNQTAPSIK